MVVPERYKPHIKTFIIKNLNQIVISGLKWTSSAQLFIQIFRVLRLSLLFYFLSPSDFGLFALALIAVQLPSVLTGESIEAGIINEKSLSPTKLDSVFWITVGSSFLIFLVYYFFAATISDLLNIDKSGFLLPFLAFFFFIESLGRVSKGILRKELRFSYLAKLETIVFSVDTLLTLLLAYLGYGPFALACGLAVSYSLSTLSYIIKAGYIPKFRFKLKSLGSIFSYSKNIVAVRFLTWMMRYLDDLIIGVFFGKQILGVYDRAYRLAHLPMRLITNRVNSVLMPSYVASESNTKEIGTIHRKVIKLSILFYLPLLCFTFLFSEFLIGLLLPKSWESLAWFLPVLCFGGIIHALINLNESLFLSFGKSDLQLKYGLITRGIIIISYLIGMQFGVKAIALAYSFGSLVAFFPETQRALKLINLPLFNLISESRNTFLFFAFLTIIMYLLTFHLGINPWLNISLYSIISAFYVYRNSGLNKIKIL